MTVGIKEAVIGRETEILDKLGIRWRDGRPHIRCPYRAHVDENPSWRWDVAKRAAICTCEERSQSIFDIIIRIEGGDFARAAARAAELIGRPDLIRKARTTTRGSDSSDTNPGLSLDEFAAAKALPEDFLRRLGWSDTNYARKPAVRIPYRATGGSEVAVRFRIAASGADKFRWAKGTKAMPYGLDRLSDAREAGHVVIVEGESDAATLWLHSIPAIGLPGATTWKEDRDAPLLDGISTVYVIIEPDTGGAAVLKWLSRSSIRSRARLVRLGGAKDPSALHIAGPDGFKAAFQRALDAAEPCPEPEAKDEDTKSGRPLALPEPEPWPQPVDGGELLDEIGKGIRTYVVFDKAAADAVALWVVAAHAFDSFGIFPRLLVTSPEKRCGKSTLLDSIERLVPRPLSAANITAAALFRVIEAARPIVILDEADTFARDNEELRGVINAGHKRNGTVVRIVETGGDYQPRQFSVWAPVVLAAIGHLPGTIEDRSIIVALKRRKPDEKVESLRLDRPNGLDVLARKAARWAADHADAVREANPAVPGSIINREADNWRPLLAIAEAAGGNWPERARQIATEFAGEVDDDSRRTQLLVDIRAAFQVQKETDRISSETLVTYLIGLEDRPWAEWSKGRPLSKNQLARLLKPLRVSPGTIWFTGGDTAKGYYRAAFDDAFARYTPSQNVRSSEAQDSCGVEPDSKPSGDFWPDVSESPGEPCVSAAPDGITDQNPGGPKNTGARRTKL
jgi:putative DNA primase/helicase